MNDNAGLIAFFAFLSILAIAISCSEPSQPVLNRSQIEACAALCGARGVETVEPSRCACNSPPF